MLEIVSKPCQEWIVKTVERVMRIQKEDRTLKVDKHWVFNDTESKSFRL